MSKKDFEAISAAIADAEIGESARKEVALSMADALVSQADSFHVPLFLRGCGLSGSLDEMALAGSEFSNRLANRISGMRHRESARA